MTELERRALMGDREAQRQCTEQGIVLRCPFCGGSENDTDGTILKVEKGGFFIHKRTGKCVLDGLTVYCLSDWNTRPAPPVGRCGECLNGALYSDGSIRCDTNKCDMDKNDYCNYFEPKGDK